MLVKENRYRPNCIGQTLRKEKCRMTDFHSSGNFISLLFHIHILYLHYLLIFGEKIENVLFS